jgi:hypothetical protein
MKVRSVAGVSEANAASIFMVRICRVCFNISRGNIGGWSQVQATGTVNREM